MPELDDDILAEADKLSMSAAPSEGLDDDILAEADRLAAPQPAGVGIAAAGAGAAAVAAPAIGEELAAPEGRPTGVQAPPRAKSAYGIDFALLPGARGPEWRPILRAPLATPEPFTPIRQERNIPRPGPLDYEAPLEGEPAAPKDWQAWFRTLTAPQQSQVMVAHMKASARALHREATRTGLSVAEIMRTRGLQRETALAAAEMDIEQEAAPVPPKIPVGVPGLFGMFGAPPRDVAREADTTSFAKPPTEPPLFAAKFELTPAQDKQLDAAAEEYVKERLRGPAALQKGAYSTTTMPGWGAMPPPETAAQRSVSAGFDLAAKLNPQRFLEYISFHANQLAPDRSEAGRVVEQGKRGIGDVVYAMAGVISAPFGRKRARGTRWKGRPEPLPKWATPPGVRVLPARHRWPRASQARWPSVASQAARQARLSTGRCRSRQMPTLSFGGRA